MQVCSGDYGGRGGRRDGGCPCGPRTAVAWARDLALSTMKRCRMIRTLGLIGAFLATSAATQPASDEQQLRDIQQGLARAWMQKDRAYIETVLGPEWSVTQ